MYISDRRVSSICRQEVSEEATKRDGVSNEALSVSHSVLYTVRS